MLYRAALPLILVSLAITVGCKSPSGATPVEKRAAVDQMHDDTLVRLYMEAPSTREYVRGAPGYAVFTNISSKLFLLGSGNGYGVAVNSLTGERTYMRMTEVGVGLGLGVKDWQAVIIFDDAATMNRFVTSGWDFGGDIEVSAATSDIGGRFSRSISVQGMTIFTFTLHGLAATAMVNGTKYWPDDELN